jgi:5-methylcytosine-specific restriction protein A
MLTDTQLHLGVRPNSNARGYTRRWRKLRNIILNRQPFCVHCLNDGRHTVATEVDHIIPVSYGGTNDDDNLQSLCKPCHSSKTGGEAAAQRQRTMLMDGWRVSIGGTNLNGGGSR